MCYTPTVQLESRSQLTRRKRELAYIDFSCIVQSCKVGATIDLRANAYELDLPAIISCTACKGSDGKLTAQALHYY